MNRNKEYKGTLTREQFLFHEMRITAGLLNQGYTEDEALLQIKSENSFQFPTERMIVSIVRTCLRRYDALQTAELQRDIAAAVFEVAKQINLYAMMRDNAIVWDFFVSVIGEKYRTQDLTFTQLDMNRFFMELQEQNDSVRGWSDSTVAKTKQVLKKCMVECGYLDTTKSSVLNPVYLYPELERGMRENGDSIAFSAFNYFE